jgi:5-hydroxyisourate hydrolase-like protein (transthyretin family)
MVVGSAHQNQEFQLFFGEGDKFSLQKPILTSYFVVIELRLDIILHDDDYHVEYQVGYF